MSYKKQSLQCAVSIETHEQIIKTPKKQGLHPFHPPPEFASPPNHPACALAQFEESLQLNTFSDNEAGGYYIFI